MDVRPDIRLLNERIDSHFARKRNTRYWLSAVMDPYDHCINFFFWSHHRGFRQRSVPLHSLASTDIDDFAAVIAGIRAHTQLTIEFYGFAKARWPATGRLIQTRPHAAELLSVAPPAPPHLPPTPTSVRAPGAPRWAELGAQIAQAAMATHADLEAIPSPVNDPVDPADPACLITVLSAPPDLATLHLQLGPTLGWGFAASATRLNDQAPLPEAAALIAEFAAAHPGPVG